MKVKSYNTSGEETGTTEVTDAVFGLKWNPDLVHQVVTSQMANRRLPIAHAKTRGEVRGGGRKPWRQKGTGRARHGSIRSPIWTGGGVTHGPRNEKSYKRKVTKSMARGALLVVLSAKAKDKEIAVIDSFEFSGAKTKQAHIVFSRLARGGGLENILKGRGVLAVLPPKNRDARRAMRNLPYADTEETRNLNAYDVARHRYILFSKDAVKELTKS